MRNTSLSIRGIISLELKAKENSLSSSKESKKMRHRRMVMRRVPFSSSFLGLLVFLTFPFPKTSSAATLFADNFELEAWGASNAGWTSLLNDPRGGNATIKATSKRPHQGRQSLEAFFAKGTQRLGLHKAGLNWNEIYVRWLVYYEPGFRFASDKKEFRTFGAGAADDLVFNTRAYSTSARWALYSHANYSAGGVPWLYTNIGSEVVIERERWYCIELHIKKGQGTGLFEGWIDGQKKWGYSNVWMGPGPMQKMELLGTFNDTSPRDQTQWVDEFMVSDHRIGCANIPPDDPPAAPTGLRIQ